MTVEELIELLRRQDPGLEVRFAYPARDFWRTTLLGPVRAVGEDLGQPCKYFGDDAVMRVDPEDEDEDKEHYVVLKS